MRETFPRAHVVPIPTPFPLEPAGSKAVVQAIRDVAAAIVLVALGAPRQEHWITRYLAGSGAWVGIGVGSAFDIISGGQPRAPRWMRDHGFEWLHRLRLNPRRLAYRYLVEDSPFVALVLVEAMVRKVRRFV
jgi:N-acetylglucosaminyldiphosphoundecaprenol N-acetyl-beta-D-mannosaminyltransferase